MAILNILAQKKCCDHEHKLTEVTFFLRLKFKIIYIYYVLYSGFKGMLLWMKNVRLY